jgi:hypothetical protein
MNAVNFAVIRRLLDLQNDLTTTVLGLATALEDETTVTSTYSLLQFP